MTCQVEPKVHLILYSGRAGVPCDIPSEVQEEKVEPKKSKKKRWSRRSKLRRGNTGCPPVRASMNSYGIGTGYDVWYSFTEYDVQSLRVSFDYLSLSLRMVENAKELSVIKLTTISDRRPRERGGSPPAPTHDGHMDSPRPPTSVLARGMVGVEIILVSSLSFPDHWK